MIKLVKITNYLGEELTLTLTQPELSGIYIESITGLGPVKADINTTEVTTADGAMYNSARANKRNIVMTLGFLAEQGSVEDNRQKTYKYFPLKQNLTLYFETDNRKCQISGYVESNEPDIFSATEKTQISIICPDPYFYAIGEVETQFFGVDPLFEFPFDNDSPSEDLIELGNLNKRKDRIIDYEGDSEVGIEIEIEVIGNAKNLAIYNVTKRERMTIDHSKLLQLTGAGLGNGDIVKISTLKGHKYIHLTRDGNTTNILNCIERDADWFRLSKGTNVFMFQCEEGTTNIQMTIKNKIIYEGI